MQKKRYASLWVFDLSRLTFTGGKFTKEESGTKQSKPGKKNTFCLVIS